MDYGAAVGKLLFLEGVVPPMRGFQRFRVNSWEGPCNKVSGMTGQSIACKYLPGIVDAVKMVSRKLQLE